ncbi:MAG: Fic family protein [Clostridiales Family XIII bacterium]|jgi:Fic family protein|nr:Fic family protein [Clostridiales Family XIII bacterium]
MTQKPPFNITMEAADYLAKIVEAVTRLEFGTGFKRDIRLHRENRVRSIHSSLAIEGNSLSLGEVTAVIDGKLVAGKQAEIKEVKNAYEAYDKVLTFDPYTIKDFLKAHKLMTDGLVKESGKFRSGDVGVFDGDVPIHVGARPQFVYGLIEELFAWAKDTDLHPVLKSAALHYEIETIHPFADGNGRMGRLWQTLMLAKWNPVFAWIPMESVVYEKKPEYYDALHAGQQTNNSNGFIEFTLSALLDSISVQAKYQGELIAAQSSGSVEFVEKFVENPDEFVEKYAESDIHKAILRLMIEQPKISAKSISEKAGMSSRGVQKNIETLKNRGLVERVGAAKGGHWVVKKPE